MRRNALIFLAALAALWVALGVAGWTAASAATDLRGYRDPTQTDALPEWMPRLGFNADLRLYEGAALAQTLEQMRSLGANWVRQPVIWSEIEALPGQYDWAEWDRILAPFAEDPMLRAVAVLKSAPDWTVDPAAPDRATAPPMDPAAFAQFAGAFAARYGAVVDHYEIWDEPNLQSGWGGQDPRPIEYLALLSAAFEAIHTADGQAQVIAAGLAPTTETGPRNLSDVRFLDQLLALGGGRFMDAAAGKPFGFDRSPLDRTVSPDVLNFSRLILLRETLEKHGLHTLPLWASGWGWNSLPADWPGAPSIWGAVTAEEQAAYTAQALDRAAREWPWLGGMALTTWQPNKAPDDPIWGFTVLEPDNQPTLLYETLAARPAATPAENALYGPTNPFTAYRGAWRFGPLGADIGSQQDSQAVFRFTGEEVALQLRQDDFVAYLFAEVDGQPANALPLDGGGNAYLILTSDTRQPETGLTTVARGLGPGEHELRLVADRGWDRWALVGFAVSSGSLSAPYVQLLAVALFTSAVALAAVVVSAARLDWGAVGRFVGRIWAAIGQAGQLVLSLLATIALLVGMMLGFGGVLPDALRRDPAALGLTAGAALVLYWSPALFLSLAAALVLFVVFYHRPDIGLMLAVFCAPFYLFPVELYRFAFPMAELALLILAGAWALRQAVDWARERQTAGRAYPGDGLAGAISRATWLDAGVAAYVGLGLLALLWSAERGPALTELRVLFLEPALFYLIVRVTAYRQPGVLLKLADALLAGAFAVAIIGLAQFAVGASVIVAEGGSMRLASVYGSPNNAALFLERALPFAFVMLLQRWDRRRRALAGLTFIACAAALTLTLSAGALFLGVPAALALVLILQFGKRGLLAVGGLAALIIAALAVALQSERFARLANLSAGTSFFRVRVWQSATQMIADHPLTGIGLDQFLYLYRGQYIAPDAWQEPNLSHPHNIALDFWLRLGLLGVVWLVLTQVAFWFRSLMLWRRSERGDLAGRALIIGAMGSMAGLLVHGLVDNSVFVNDLALVFMLLLAIPASLRVSRPTSD